MGLDYESNLGSVAAWLRRTATGFGLNSPSSKGHGTVGDRLARTLAGRIHDRGMRFVGTAGAWPMNAESTAKAKGFNAPNFVTGQMLDPADIAGEVSSTPTETTIVQGTGQANARGVTDRDRAHYAETGQSAKRIVRSFFGVTGDDADALEAICLEEWEHHARQP